MKRDFDFTKKDTYTEAEVAAILGQHTTFVESGFKGFVSAEDHKKTTDELHTFTAAKRGKHISSLVTEKKLTDSDDKVRDAIALAKITDEDDDEAVLNKVQDVIKERVHLQSNVESADELLLKKHGAKKAVKEEVDEKLKNV